MIRSSHLSATLSDQALSESSEGLRLVRSSNIAYFPSADILIRPQRGMAEEPSLEKNQTHTGAKETRGIKRGAASPRHPVYTHSHIYWLHVISREIDLCEIAPSRAKRAPRVWAAAGANRSKTKQRKSPRDRGIKFGRGGRCAIKRKIPSDFRRRFLIR